MQGSDFLLMRHELLLTAMAAIILIMEIFRSKQGSRAILTFAMVMFGAITLIGFLAAPEGQLFGGMYQTDALRLLMKNILNIGVFIVLLQSYTWLSSEENKDKASEYVILLISTVIGLNFLISSGDFLMFFLGVELATIPVAALAAFDRFRNHSAEAGVKLILISALSSGIMLYGLSMIYGTTGTIYFNEIAAVIGNGGLPTLALIFFMAGMGFKISIVPFHLWAADVYEGAPTNVTSYLSVISKGGAIFIFTLVMFTVFKSFVPVWQDVMYVLTIATITIGNLFALRQDNIKRFLAFSSIANAGFILLGILPASQTGMTSVIYFVLIYIFSNLGVFGVVSAIESRTGKINISDYKGLYSTNPRLSLMMLVSLFSLAGIPPVAGFFGKFFLFMASAEQGFYILVLIAVVNTIISLYYYLQVVKAIFLTKSDEAIAPIRSDFPTRLGLIICIVGIIATGFLSVIYGYIHGLSFGG